MDVELQVPVVAPAAEDVGLAAGDVGVAEGRLLGGERVGPAVEELLDVGGVGELLLSGGRVGSRSGAVPAPTRPTGAAGVH